VREKKKNGALSSWIARVRIRLWRDQHRWKSRLSEVALKGGFTFARRARQRREDKRGGF